MEYMNKNWWRKTTLQQPIKVPGADYVISTNQRPKLNIIERASQIQELFSTTWKVNLCTLSRSVINASWALSSSNKIGSDAATIASIFHMTLVALITFEHLVGSPRAAALKNTVHWLYATHSWFDSHFWYHSVWSSPLNKNVVSTPRSLRISSTPTSIGSLSNALISSNECSTALMNPFKNDWKSWLSKTRCFSLINWGSSSSFSGTNL